MKKIEVSFLLVIIAILLILLVSFNVGAQEDVKIDKAYSCLEDKVKDKCDSLSVEEQAFNVLAIGQCSSELKDKSKNEECWPSSGCRLRDTALSVLALNRAGKSTDKAETYLLNQNETPKDLMWYLEIDANEETTCKITYSTTEKTITIGEDKKIDKNAGTCLTLAQDNYWLKISESCYGTKFTISCDKNFLTTLLYKKKTGSTVYVSSQTESAPAEGSTEHQVNALCFKQDASCNYEGSLWTTLALAETGHDVSQFLPYLIAMEDENEKYFPSAFLYMITAYDEYFTKIIEEQKEDYWKISSSPYNQFYDTALALLALYGLDAEQAKNAKTYLLEVQGTNGCWNNNIRDTAFVLYAAFPKSVSPTPDVDYCEDYNNFCVLSGECDAEDKIDLPCYAATGKVCCKIPSPEKTCDEKEGIECNEDQECTGSLVPASGTDSCCKGSCIAKEEKSECEKQNYTCRYSCLDDEEEKAYDCGEEKTCCAPAPQPSPSYWWIWLLVTLIILVILGIIFRNQLRIWLFRIKGGFRRGPAPTRMTRPGFPPAPPPGARMMPRPRMIMPRQFQPVRAVKRAITKTDKELEETLKKLKEMSK